MLQNNYFLQLEMKNKMVKIMEGIFFTRQAIAKSYTWWTVSCLNLDVPFRQSPFVT